ncbi:MAG TPA: 30S ribosome-binding factor RbfA [Vicinamibacteria bacterium]|nr:30S ribosome-binding factor RbfA [Vicinamibacteria bacterium]
MSRRTERLAEEIREEVALLIASELKDPRIGFVTVTRVEVTPDLRTARIYVGVLGTEKQRTTSLAGLKQGAGFLRRALGRTLRLRYTPELVFQYDEGLEASDRVAKLLAEIGSSPTAAPAENSEDDDE